MFTCCDLCSKPLSPPDPVKITRCGGYFDDRCFASWCRLECPGCCGANEACQELWADATAFSDVRRAVDLKAKMVPEWQQEGDVEIEHLRCLSCEGALKLAEVAVETPCGYWFHERCIFDGEVYCPGCCLNLRDCLVGDEDGATETYVEIMEQLESVRQKLRKLNSFQMGKIKTYVEELFEKAS